MNKGWMCAVGALLVFLICTASVPVQAAEGWQIHPNELARDYEGNWHWANNWQPYAADGNATNVSSYYWLKVPLPDSLPDKAALFFTTDDHELEAYYDGVRIYRYGNLKPKERLLGSTWHMIALPEKAAGGELYLHVYANNPRNRLHLDDVRIAPERELYAELIRDNLDYMFAASLGVMMLLFMGGAWLLLKETIYLRTGCFFLLLAIWAVGESPLGRFFWDDPAAWRYLVLACMYALPISFAFMLGQFAAPRWRASVKLCRALLLLYAVLAISGSVFKAGLLRDAMTGYFLLLVAGIVVFLGSLIAAVRDGNQEARWLCGGVAVLPLLAVYDIAGGFCHWVPWHHHTTTLGCVSLAFVLLAVFCRRMSERRQLQEANHRLQERVNYVTHLSQTDPLTGLYNRIRFNQAMEQLKQERSDDATLILFDIDYFKRVNDSCGHDVGDRVLVELARLVSATVGDSGMVARLGGEEFAVLCRKPGLAAAVELAERLRQSIEQRFAEEPRPITCSFGVSRWRGGDTPERFAKRADQALYAAKEGGRNRICSENVISIKGRIG